MAFLSTLSHAVGATAAALKFSETSFDGELNSLLSSFSSSVCFMGSPLTSYPSTFPGKGSNFTTQKGPVVYAKRISGLEEAIRIRRERELQSSTASQRRPPLRRGNVSQWLPVPDHIPKPPYVGTNILPEISKEYQIHDSEGIWQTRCPGTRLCRNAG